MKIWMYKICKMAYDKLLNLGRVQFFLKVSRDLVTLITLSSPPNYVSEYYKYCVKGILDAIENPSKSRLAVFLSNQSFHFCRKTKTIVINTEHTLVRKNGRDSAGSSVGSIPVVDSLSDEKYLVRIPGGTKEIAGADQVIEYSIPNLINVLQSEHKHLYAQKSHYVAPLLSPRMLNPVAQGRDTSKAFTFMSLPEGGDRRTEIMDKLVRSGVRTANLSGLVGDASGLMSRIGILVNLHQTDHHHTLEELRILPALLQGVLVVSEPAPLTDKIPYSKFVTFASIEEMPSVISYLQENYETCWSSTFSTGEFTKVIAELEQSNKNVFKEIVSNLSI